MTNASNEAGQYGADRFTVKSRAGVDVDATYLTDLNGKYVIDGLTGKPYIVPADYNPKALIEKFTEIRFASYSGWPSEHAEVGARSRLYATLYETFKQGGVGDLQRHYNGSNHGADGFVPAFTNAASFNFGLIGAVLGISSIEIKAGGSLYNLYNSLKSGGEKIDTFPSSKVSRVPIG